MTSQRSRFIQTMITAMGGDPLVPPPSGVAVYSDPKRAESHVTAGYQFDDQLIVTCDPAAADMLTQELTGTEPTLAAWQQRAAELGGELLGAGRMQTVPDHGLRSVEIAPEYTLTTLQRANAQHVALIQKLIDASSEDDLDEAEIAIDDLDPHICAILGPDGAVAAYGAARSFDMTPDFGDIGVLTTPEHRGKDLGKAVVFEISAIMERAGLHPLYRCDEDNAGSIGLSASLGFELATQLVAFRFAV